MYYILSDVLYTLHTVDLTKTLYFKLISRILSEERGNVLVDVHGILINILSHQELCYDDLL